MRPPNVRLLANWPRPDGVDERLRAWEVGDDEHDEYRALYWAEDSVHALEQWADAHRYLICPMCDEITPADEPEWQMCPECNKVWRAMAGPETIPSVETLTKLPFGWQGSP